MRHLLCLALVIGCSDRSAPGASDGGGDAGRRRDAGTTGEACDGADDDGDGAVDEGCECDPVGDVRGCDRLGECATRVQRCVNQDEFGSAWSGCESVELDPECTDAGLPPPIDAGVPPPSLCGRAGATADPRDVCWAPATIPVDAGCAAAGAYKRFDPAQGLWVGVVECSSPTGFRIFLSDPAFGDWRPATDGAGHGQDHCELVDPAFRIPDEDDITSGGCASCTAGGLVFSRGPVYARHRFGECFTEETAVMDWPWLTSVIYCGLSGATLAESGDRCRAAM
jgi:hypothetical protein